MSGLIRKIQRRKNALKYIEVLEDVNCIPKGVYKVSYFDGLFYHFTVGGTGLFGISSDAPLRILPSLTTMALTDAHHFIDRYYELLRELPFKRPNPEDPHTFGMVHSQYAREMQ